MEDTIFPSKVLLFGEYSVIRGSKALAMPFGRFSGRWTREGKPSEEEKASLDSLKDQLMKLQAADQLKASLALEDFASDLDRGWYFQSTIPVGYGMGSSGALSAGMFARYHSGPFPPLPVLKEQLAQIESVFHGSSSGFDPLVSLVGKPLVVEAGSVEEVKLAGLPNYEFFLLNTGMGRSTAPLVRIFLGKCEDLDFDLMIENELGVLNNLAIGTLLNGEEANLAQLFKAISQFEWDHFQEMIPDAFKGVWKQGLISGGYQLKLCGAGGGGFLLGLTSDLEATKKDLEDFELIRLPLEQ
jgi:mevalonate kinase